MNNIAGGFEMIAFEIMGAVLIMLSLAGMVTTDTRQHTR